MIINSYTFDSTVYLLDTYTAKVAYSFRKLRTGVTDVCRIRRSSDSAELDFTPTEITDGTLTTWTGAGDGFVIRMYGQTATASSDIAQPTAANQPKIVSAGTLLTKGGLPAMLFDGSNDMLLSGGAHIATLPFSFFSVSNSTGTETIGAVFNLSNSSISTHRIFNDSRTATNRNYTISNTVPTSSHADLSTARVDTNQRLLSSFCDASKNMSAFDNGSTGGTATYTGSVVIDAMSIGAQYNGGWVNHLTGSVQELIAFESDQTSNRSAIETDINDHYSIY